MLKKKCIVWLIIAIGAILVASVFAVKYMSEAETCVISEETLLGINDLSALLKQAEEIPSCENQ